MATQGRKPAKPAPKKAAKPPPKTAPAKRKRPRNSSGVLTEQQARFAAEYLVYLHGTRAAIAAGYSKKSAPSISSQLLKLPQVAAAIARGQVRKIERAEINADFALSELAKIARANLGDAASWAGKGFGTRIELFESEELG